MTDADRGRSSLQRAARALKQTLRTDRRCRWATLVQHLHLVEVQSPSRLACAIRQPSLPK